MPAPLVRRYATEELEEMLAGGGRLGLAERGILGRRPSEWISTYPCEVLTCRQRSGARVEVLMKYAPNWAPDPWGHHRRLAHEAHVYANVLDGDPGTTPGFHGSGEDPHETSAWLAIEYLEGALRLHCDPDLMPAAAGWIGAFHRRHEIPPRGGDGGLPAYDSGYYRACARRTALFAGRSHAERPWLNDVCDRIDEVAELLLEPPTTVVHGEYYPKNILVRDGRIYPVDWETATLAAGEIDLACLTERWPAPVRHACERAYAQARWDGDPPAGFGRRLDAARFYLMLRWLGDLTISEGRGWRFQELHAAAARLGLM